MERLIDDYEKALTEEFELRQPVVRLPEQLRSVKAQVMSECVLDDPNLPQWKAQEFVHVVLDGETRYQGFRKAFIKAEYEHGLAKIRLAVAVERLKLTRARLHGGRHDQKD